MRFFPTLLTNAWDASNGVKRLITQAPDSTFAPHPSFGLSRERNRKVVVPFHLLGITRCDVDLVVHASVLRNFSPVSQNLPSVILTGVRAFAGGDPLTRSGVKSDLRGRPCLLTTLNCW